MKQLKQLLLVMAIALTGITPAQAQTTPFNHYSEWMAKSRENYVYINGGKNDFWRYDDGLMYESILDTYEHYKNNGADLSGTTLLDEVKWYLKNSLTKGTEKPNNYKSSELDDVRPAKLVWKYYNTYPTDTERDYLDNCEYVMGDIENMRRAIPNDNTSPWEHKESYGNQVWLDGIFMCIPYYTLAGPTIGLKTNSSWTTDYIFQDAYTQIMVTDEKTYDRKTNLWKHAWDALGTRTWADCQNKKLYKDFEHTAEELAKPVGTGTWQSLHTWGRALGWYVMAIMETIDNMIAYDTAHSTDHSTQINNLKILFKRVVDSYIQYRDESNGCWYCVLDVDDTKKPYSSISVKRANYLEGTCSSMFTYALLHGVNKGYLPLSYTSLAKKAYKDLVEYFIKADGEKIKLDDCISVAGLDDGAVRRDGSFAYYMDESVIASDSKGVGPFIWASLEAEKMGYTLVKNSSNFSVNFNSLDQTGINVYKWSKVYDEIDNLSAEYTSPTFTAKTVAGTTIANSGITFNSNNPSVATVSPNGTVTLVGTGLATITATKDGMVSYYSVKVNSIQPQVETPAISITEGTNTFIGENTTVTIACDTENADIYYTTDGSEPDNTATHYTGTFTISATTTVKAIAIKTGYDDSEIASETFTQDNTAPTLEGSTPKSGATNVSTSGTIVLTFSEDVACTTNATLTTTGSSAISLTPTVSGSTVTYSYSGLSNETSYTFNLDANSVADLAGNKYDSAINITFTTTTETDKYYILAYTEMTPAGVLTSASNSNQSLKYVKYNGSTYATTSEISSDFPSNKNGKYSNSSITNILNTSNWASGSGSSYATGIVLSKNTTYTLNLNSNNISKISFLCYPAGNTSSISIGGTEKTTSTKEWTLHEWSGSFTGEVSIKLSNANDIYGVFVLEKASGSTPPTPSTYTLTNTVNPEGYGTVNSTTVANIPSGTAVTAGTGDNINKYTVGETTVTATPATATDEYTYTFTGWSDLPETVTANATVKANFTRTAKSYTLAWNKNSEDADDLTGNYTNGSTAYGTTLTPPSTPTRSGYTFLKWNTAANGSGTDYTGTMPAANTTYYAQWVLEGEETSETVTPTGIDSSNNLTFSPETNLVVNLPNGSMEYDEAKFKGDAAIDISSVGSKYIKEIVITYDATSKRHPDAANDLTIKNVTSNGSVVTSGSVLGSVTSSTSEPFTTTWSDNSGAKNINKVTLNYANNSHSLYISNIKVTYWGASETPTVEAPTFTAHPANATYTQGDTPTALSVTATGNPAPTYQWYKNTDNDKTAKVADQIEGATAATLPVANISTATAGTFYYYCVATNSKGTATSNSATITVNAPTLAISTQPIGASYTQDDTATALSVTATGGSTPYSYQWYSNDTNDTETPTAVGTNSDSYTPSTTTVGTTYYYCIVTDNASTTVTSNIVAITVNTSGGGGGEPETYKLVNDPTGTPSLSGDFLTANLTLNQNTTQTIDGIAFKNGLKFSSSLSSITNKAVGENNFCYDIKTSQTKFTIYVAGTTGKIRFSTIAEGATTTSVEEKVIDSNPQKLEFTFNSTTNTRVGFSVSSSSMIIYQVLAEESGTPHKQAGEAGYVLNLNCGRYAGNVADTNSGKSGKIDNIEIVSYNNYKHTNTTALELEKNSANTYIKFTTGASACKLKTTYSNGTLIVNTSQSTSGGTALTSATAQELDANTTYYIINTHANNRAPITKIEFESAVAPTTYDVSKGTETNGTFTISPTSAAAGATITVTTSPESGYSVGTVTATKAGSGTVEVTNTATNTYTFTMPADDVTVNVTFEEEVAQVATPTISPVDGTEFAGTTQNVSISCATAGANIYYTLDGTTPTSSSTHYTAAFTIYGTKTVKAIAIKEGMTNSIMAAATITNTCLNEYTDGTLLLKEAATDYTPVAATGVDVTLTRTLQANKWNALCLPFDVTPAMFSSATNGATTNLETLKGVNNGIFTFAEVTEVAAGTPFIAKPASNIVNPTFSDVEIKAVSPGSTTKDGYKFQGTYTKVTLDPATNLFISMSQQKMVPPTGSNILQGLRAYFIVPEGEGARVGIDFNAFIEEITTDINQLNMEHLPIYSDDNTPLYNLSGQRVSKSYKGIVIVNGKKVLRK